MKNTRGIRRHHVNLGPASAERLDRLINHLAAAHPEKRVTASSAIRYALEKQSSAFAAIAAL